MTRGGRRVGAAALAAGLVLAGALVNPERAWACECAGISLRRALGDADAAFVGTVTAARDVGRGEHRRTDLRFRVSRAIKGTVYADQVVATPPDAAACGLRPEVGSSWLIFAADAVEGEGGSTVYRLKTTTCSGNRPGDDLPAGFGRSRPPLPGASDREEVSLRTDAALTRALTVGGLGLLVVLGLAGAGLAVLWRPRS